MKKINEFSNIWNSSEILRGINDNTDNDRNIAFASFEKDSDTTINTNIYSNRTLLDTIIRNTINSYNNEHILSNSISNIINTDTFNNIISNIKNIKNDIKTDLTFLRTDHLEYLYNNMISFFMVYKYIADAQAITNKITDYFYLFLSTLTPVRSIEFINAFIREINSIINVLSNSIIDIGYAEENYSNIVEFYNTYIVEIINNLIYTNNNYIQYDNTNINLTLDTTLNFPTFNTISIENLTDILINNITKLEVVRENIETIGKIFQTDMLTYIDDIQNILENSISVVKYRSINEDKQEVYSLSDDESAILDNISANNFLLLGVFSYNLSIFDENHVIKNNTISSMNEIILDLKKQAFTMLNYYWESIKNIDNQYNKYGYLFTKKDNSDDSNILSKMQKMFEELLFEKEYQLWIQNKNIYTFDIETANNNSIMFNYTIFDETLSRLYYLSYKLGIKYIYNNIIVKLIDNDLILKTDFIASMEEYLNMRESYQNKYLIYSDSPNSTSINYYYKEAINNLKYCENMEILEAILVDENNENGYIDQDFLNNQSFLIFKELMIDTNKIKKKVSDLISACYRNKEKSIKDLSIELAFINLLEKINFNNFDEDEDSEINTNINVFISRKTEILEYIKDFIDIQYFDTGLTDDLLDVLKDNTIIKDILTLDLNI